MIGFERSVLWLMCGVLLLLLTLGCGGRERRLVLGLGRDGVTSSFFLGGGGGV